MNAEYQLVAALLRLWPGLPGLAQEEWPGVAPRLLDLLRAFAQADGPTTRMRIALDIHDLLDALPEVTAALETALKGDRDRPDAARDAGDERGAAGGLEGDLPASDAEVREQLDSFLQDQERRVVNAWVEGTARDEPLLVGATYALKFDVGPPRPNARGQSSLAIPFADAEEGIEVVVVLETDDFTVHGSGRQTLIVPRRGPSRNIAAFEIAPRKSGTCAIEALFFAHDRIFQRMTLTFEIGSAGMMAAARGTTIDSAGARSPIAGQAINLVIDRREGGYRFLLHGGGVARASINLTPAQVAELIADARDRLHDIVFAKVDGRFIYQDTLTIPDAIHADVLKRLETLGRRLFDGLFYGPRCGPDARQMGDLLRELSRRNRLRIEVVADQFIFPWALLYDRRRQQDGDGVDPEGFWGFKHVIEHLPEFTCATPVSFDPRISPADRLGIACVLNTAIDAQVQRPLVQSQREFLRGLSRVTATEYTHRQHLVDLLNDPDAPPLLYFYCHAASYLPHEPDGVAGSKLMLTDGAITLRDLQDEAPTSEAPLKQAPLIFLNACESAKLSPYFYDGLVPYLITRGARGVLGTEAEIPALFAAEFARELLAKFVGGAQPIGELLLELRRKHLFKNHNVLGLLYALYCNADVAVHYQA